MAVSPNKNYNLQGTGTNINTWGVVLNANLSTIDSNLGGTLNIDVSGNLDINLTADQSKNLIHNLSGAITGDIDYVFPQQGGFYAINNNTSGNFTVTAKVSGGATGFAVTQGTTTTVYIDASVPAVYSFSGSQSVFTGASVGGTGDAVTIPTTIPSGFLLVPGALVSFTPVAPNFSDGPTVSVAGTDTLTIKSIGATGIRDLPAFSLLPESPIIMQLASDGSSWIALNVVYNGTVVSKSSNFSIGLDGLFSCYYSTAPLVASIASSFGLENYWWAEFNALGGAITLTPDAGDSINGQSAGTSFVIPQGASGKLETDANGKFILNFCTTNVPNSRLATMAANTIKSNITGSSATPLDNTLSAILDAEASSSQGVILYRGSSAWTALAPGTNGQYLKTQGAGANPAWASFASVTGTVLQIVENFSSVSATSSSIIPFDTTIPQNTEGSEFTQAATAFTPMSASSTLIIEVYAFLTPNSFLTNGRYVAACLFQDSIANAIQVGAATASDSTNFLGFVPVYFSYKTASGGTSLRTYKMRYGNGATGGTSINGNGVNYGGTVRSGIRVTEILV